MKHQIGVQYLQSTHGFFCQASVVNLPLACPCICWPVEAGVLRVTAEEECRHSYLMMLVQCTPVQPLMGG